MAFGRMGARGGFGSLGSGGGSNGDPLAPLPPVLDLVAASDTGSSSTDNYTTDTTPDIDITFPSGASAGDIIQLYDNGSALGSPHTLTSPEALAAAWTSTLGTLAEGAHSLQATHQSGTHTSRKSNALVVTIDTTAPTLSSPSAAQLAQTTASLGVSTNEAIGTLYWVVTTSATPPSASQVKAGQNNGGTAALASGSQAVTATGAQAATATGVTVGTRYAYFMHEDLTSNQSGVSASSSWSQADISTPTLSAASGSATAQTTATLSVTTDKGAGTLYAVITTRNTTPSVAQIKAGQDDLGAAATYSSSQAVSSTGVKTFSATGLTNGLSGAVTYYAYFVHNNGVGFDSNRPSGTWSQTDVTAPTLSSPSGTATGGTTADLAVTTNENNGTLYGVLTLTSTPPSKAQVKVGQNSAGAAAAYSFSQAVSGTGSQTKSATGLTAVTTYYAHYMHEDAAGNQANVSSASSFTTSSASTTLNASDKAAHITLSNGNLTATDNAGTSYAAVRAVASRSTGKYYYEASITTVGGSGLVICGIANSTQSLTNYVGSTTNSAGCIGSSGLTLVNGSVKGTAQSVNAGQVMCVAIDLDNMRMWTRRNGLNWNNNGSADPATNTGGFDISALAAGPYYPAVNTFDVNDALTLNFGGSAYAQTAPSGFGNW